MKYSGQTEDAQNGDDDAAYAVKSQHCSRRLCQRVLIFLSDQLRNDDFNGHLKAAGNSQKNHDDVGGISDCGQFVCAQKTADHGHVDDAVKLRNQHAQRNRPGKQANFGFDFSCCQFLCHFNPPQKKTIMFL